MGELGSQSKLRDSSCPKPLSYDDLANNFFFWLRQCLVPAYSRLSEYPNAGIADGCHHNQLKKLLLPRMANPQIIWKMSEFHYHVTKFKIRGG